MRKKILLLLDNSFNAIPFMLAARKLGYFVVTTGLYQNEFSQSFSNQYIQEDYSDFDKISFLYKKLNATAISCGTHDDMSYTASYIDNLYKIGGHDSLENIKTLHLKDNFKEFAKSLNIHSPLSHLVKSTDDARLIMQKIKYPVIIKPTDRAGGKGVKVITNKDEFLDGIEYCFNESFSNRILIEEFIEGSLHSFTTFIQKQKVIFYCTYNDYSYVNKYMTNSGIAPATHDNMKGISKIIIRDIEKMARELQLVDGLFHLQYIVDKNSNPFIIEVMRRAPGNWSTSIGSISTGLNIDEWIIRSECGHSLSSLPTKMTKPHGIYGYHTILGDRNGVLDSVYFSRDIKQNIYNFFQWHHSGFQITNYLHTKIGVVFLYFATFEEMHLKMKQINTLITIKYI